MGFARGGSNPLAVAVFCVLSFFSRDLIVLGQRGKLKTEPNIAQLVERSTVEFAGIEWSLVRFRVFGFFR